MEAKEKLLAYVDRLERLYDDLAAVKADIKELKDEIKGDGFNVRALAKLATLRGDKRKQEAEAELISDLLLYAHTAGTELLSDDAPASEQPA